MAMDIGEINYYVCWYDFLGILFLFLSIIKSQWTRKLMIVKENFFFLRFNAKSLVTPISQKIILFDVT